VARVKELEDELAKARAREAMAEAGTLAASASDGAVVARRDGLTPGDLRTLAIATRDALGSGIVALVGVQDGKAGHAVAVSTDKVEAGVAAADLARDAAKALGGGTAKHADVVQGGGQHVDKIDDALALLDAAVHTAGA
jgi:alanyl-tRNA synthetase